MSPPAGAWVGVGGRGRRRRRPGADDRRPLRCRRPSPRRRRPPLRWPRPPVPPRSRCSSCCFTSAGRSIRPWPRRSRWPFEHRGPRDGTDDAVHLEARRAGSCAPRRRSAVRRCRRRRRPACWTCATSSPWLPTRSGRPPSRISIALLAGDSAATAALERRLTPEPPRRGAAGPRPPRWPAGRDVLLAIVLAPPLRQQLPACTASARASGARAQAGPGPRRRSSSMSPSFRAYGVS